ncbi:MAG: hypothetical protein ABR611_12655 [Chthoniobacterales bacterium]
MAILAIRLAALYAWFQALEYVAAGTLSLFLVGEKGWQTLPLALLFYALPGVMMTGTGFVLWLNARRLARHFGGEQSNEVAVTRSSAAALAFAVVGLAVFLYALPRVVSECIDIVQNERFLRGMVAPEFLRRYPALAGNALQLALGFMLFVRPHKLARWWERKRDGNVSVSTGGRSNSPHN